jgi:signal peptidase I
MLSKETIDQIARTPLSEVLIFALVLTMIRLISYVTATKIPVHKQRFFHKGISIVGEWLDSFIFAAIAIFMVARPYLFQMFQIPTGSMVPTSLVGDYNLVNKAVYRYTDPKRGDIVVFRPPAEACNADQIDKDGTVRVDFVKRLVGMPGELVEIKQGQVFIDGKPLFEPYKQLTATEDGKVFSILTPEQKAIWPKANWKLVKYNNMLYPLNYTEYDANSRIPRNEGIGYPYSVVSKYAIDDPTEWSKVKDLPAEKIPNGYYLFMGDNRNGSSDGRAWGLIPRSNIVGRAEFVWFPLSRFGKMRFIDNGEKAGSDAIVPEFLR